MSRNRILTNKLAQDKKVENAPGIKINPGPYEAEVANVLDTTRAGRLQVWIPELSAADKTDPNNWFTCSYASPYAGKTSASKSTLNAYDQTSHSYGFWATPPDVGNIVLCIFVNGDAGRGYWFGCTIDKMGFGMVPAVAGGTSNKLDLNNLVDPNLANSLTNDSVWPMADAQENLGENVDDTFITALRPPHEFQVNRVITQGLDRDPVRGAITSSAQRDMPSSVFGISTPGRSLTGDTADNPDLQARVASGQLTELDFYTMARKGGHSIVMDDGDFYGESQLMRFKTTSGHQILMDDHNGLMYIANSEGTCYIEMTSNGQIHIYSQGGFNLRTQGSMNLHSDQAININSGDSINLSAATTVNINSQNYNQLSSDTSVIYGSIVQVGSSGSLNLSAGGIGSFKSGGTLQLTGVPLHLNTSTGPIVQAPDPIATYLLDDTLLDAETNLWTIQPEFLSSIVNVAPSHEPWSRVSGTPLAGV
jgi:hypothetical protein